ncbi:hypothetical protein GQ43DRAFT_337378, partial [Delitschia confertaspora ATCC 74209]
KPSSSSSLSSEKKRRDRPLPDTLRGNGVAVVTGVEEKRRPSSKSQRGGSRTKAAPRASQREGNVYQSRQDYQYRDTYRRTADRPSLNVQVPHMWHRAVQSENDFDNSSTEMLLNPRPHRSPHERRRHPNRTSQTTLRGRGAKRDPPRGSKSKNKSPPKQSSWSLFGSPPPKTPSRDQRYNAFESSPRSHRSSRHRNNRGYQQLPEPLSSSSQPQPRNHRSRQQHSTQQTAQSRIPNTAAHRVPDRRFAVLAATNQALEELRREAFAHQSPPPRRQRVRRVQGVAIPTREIPFNWDCVSSQTSAGTG